MIIQISIVIFRTLPNAQILLEKCIQTLESVSTLPTITLKQTNFSEFLKHHSHQPQQEIVFIFKVTMHYDMLRFKSCMLNCLQSSNQKKIVYSLNFSMFYITVSFIRFFFFPFECNQCSNIIIKLLLYGKTSIIWNLSQVLSVSIMLEPLINHLFLHCPITLGL